MPTGAGALSGRSSRWVLTLYVSGAAPHSAAAITALREVCATDLPGLADLRIVDVNEVPAQAVADEVVAVPTLVRSRPLPRRRLVGDLSDPSRLRQGLDLPVQGPTPAGQAEMRAR